MALFRIKKDEEKKAEDAVVSAEQKTEEKTAKKTAPKKETKKKAETAPLNARRDIASVLIRPRVTEKATFESEKGVYVFNVSPRATKYDVAEAIKTTYKVTPRKINMVAVPSKKVRARGSRNIFGTKSGGKKAYVYVKKGDTIDIV